MRQDLITRRADAERGRAWTMDGAGRVRECPDHADAVAHGWVDAVGGVGRIEARDAGHPEQDVLEALATRYPGVRWLSGRAGD